ncbi:Heat shock protein GrpE [hydrothermal vent metagenome]|uniref:Heat shock protein GrpE n=1 Tax=hydrothermal vent metagenome TaxID=652676 RepID=A0A3B1BLM6_9ZZZZ
MKKSKKNKTEEDKKITVEKGTEKETVDKKESTISVELENLEERVAELEEKNNELNDRLLRRAAEFENYKRRTENEKDVLFKYAAEPFILKVLPIYDDLKRSLSHIDNDNLESVRDGFKMIADKFTQVLEAQGVKKIDSVGKEFDYEYHEALLQQPSEEYPENIIIEEIEPGYIYKDKVLKHSKVIVSQGMEKKEEAKVDKDENAKE